MRPFTEDDAGRFFGRDTDLDRIVRWLRRGVRELYIIGASGSGKSSLIAAGLVPRLMRGPDQLPRFHVRTLRPGEQPLDRLAVALEGDRTDLAVAVEPLLARHAPAASLLLVIDQLEELFTIANEDQRRGFLAAVRALRADSRCVLVFTLRADFYGAFMESSLWTDRDGDISRIDLGLPRGNDLRMVVERPARELGVYFQPELVSRLLDDAAHEPGALPLLQETLFLLWGKRRGRLLALADYHALGDGSRTGLAFAIKEHADDVLSTLTSGQRPVALRIFLRLVAFGEGRADTRRQQPRDALRSDGEPAADFDIVLQRLVEHRLVTVTGDDQHGDVRVDLAHEILIHAWSTLSDWIRTWRAFEQHRRELEATAAAWRRRGGGNGGLLDAFELAGATAWHEKAVQLGHSSELAALLASSEAALTRARRKRRSLIALAVAPFLVIGTLATIQIVVERNRAEVQRAEAVRRAEELAEAVRRAEELTLAQARYIVDQNPTKAVAMLKPLAAKYWREARAIGAAAHAAGVAWSLPVAKHTLSLEMTHDGTRALSAGDDGMVRIHDLARRTTRPVIDLGVPVKARLADGDRRVVVWHDYHLVVIDLANGQRRDITAPTEILNLEVVSTTAYWVDAWHALWHLELAGAAPVQLPLAEPVVSLTPSPDGRWIGLVGKDHLFLYDRTQPAAAARQVLGRPDELFWSADSKFLAAMMRRPPRDGEDGERGEVLTLQPELEAPIVELHMVPHRLSVAYHGGKLYAAGPTGVVIVDESGDFIRKPIAGSPVGIVEARGGTMVAGANDGLTVMSDDGDRILPLLGARIEGVAASPRSPYVLARLEGRLLVWNLDDVQPRRLVDQVTGPARFGDPGHVIAGATLNIPTQAIDLATGAARSLGPWQDLREVTSAGADRAVAILDGEHRVHLAIPGREPVDLPGDNIDVAGFATEDLLVLATLDGQVFAHDVARGQRTALIQGHTQLLGLAWGRGRHPWVAAAFADGTLWRKNLVTSVLAAKPPAKQVTHSLRRQVR